MLAPQSATRTSLVMIQIGGGNNRGESHIYPLTIIPKRSLEQGAKPWDGAQGPRASRPLRAPRGARASQKFNFGRTVRAHSERDVRAPREELEA